MTHTLGIKVDVDTLRGYTVGVPRLLELFAKHELRASIFFSLGPDNSGKAVRRVFRRGFISKMIRTKAPSTYGLKTLLYGTLLPAPMIVDSDPGILRRAHKEGHDCGVHAWDHVLVQDQLDAMTEEQFEALYRKAASKYEEILGSKPASYAARMQADINLNNFLAGMVKTPFFAVIIGVIGCFQGFQVTGSAESVGRLTTHAVVEAIFMVIVCDALFALFFTGIRV